MSDKLPAHRKRKRAPVVLEEPYSWISWRKFLRKAYKTGFLQSEYAEREIAERKAGWPARGDKALLRDLERSMRVDEIEKWAHVCHEWFSRLENQDRRWLIDTPEGRRELGRRIDLTVELCSIPEHASRGPRKDKFEDDDDVFDDEG
jgi:hypothetical protein